MPGIDPRFSPDDPGVANGNYFGLPFTQEQADLVLIPVPWDVTVSYGAGAARGPRAILDASLQVELLDAHNPEGWRRGIASLPVHPWIVKHGPKLRRGAMRVIRHLEGGGSVGDRQIHGTLDEVNRGGAELNEIVYQQALDVMRNSRGEVNEKIVGVVGGDHSVPLGLMRAVAQLRGEFGILHIDAHADLRVDYEGFNYSHASIMHNALQMAKVTKLVQVGIRDYSDGEVRRAQAAGSRIVQFDDHKLARAAFEGVSWGDQCGRIVEQLPERVYVSFDIDGLSPDNCPATGTPVPGGLSFAQAVYLLLRVVESGRTIVGFDLSEVAPRVGDGQWNANVGARMLYKLCNLALRSHPNV